MENASKALIMAGEVLIGVIILSILVFMFNKVNEFTESYHENAEKQKLIAFNAQYTKYITNNTAENATHIYAEDIVTIVNQARDWNTKASNDGEKIKVEVYKADEATLEYDIESFNGVEFLNKYKLRIDDGPENKEYIFSCLVTLNETTGRVNLVKIVNKGEKTT